MAATQWSRRIFCHSASPPTVVGTVHDLGYCLDLTASLGLKVAQNAHADLIETCRLTGNSLPENHPDGLRNYLTVP